MTAATSATTIWWRPLAVTWNGCPSARKWRWGLAATRTLRLFRIGNDVHMSCPRRGRINRWDARLCSPPGSRIGKGELRGYILKKDSPSCGMERVRVFDAHGSALQVRPRTLCRSSLSTFPICPWKKRVGFATRASERILLNAFLPMNDCVCSYPSLEHCRPGGIPHCAQVASDGPFTALLQEPWPLVAEAKSVPEQTCATNTNRNSWARSAKWPPPSGM